MGTWLYTTEKKIYRYPTHPGISNYYRKIKCIENIYEAVTILLNIDGILYAWSCRVVVYRAKWNIYERKKKKLLARTLVSCRRQEHGTISLLCYISFSVCFVWFIDFSEDYLWYDDEQNLSFMLPIYRDNSCQFKSTGSASLNQTK